MDGPARSHLYLEEQLLIVWISKKGKTGLLTFTGIMDADFYVEEVLTKGLLPFANSAYGPGRYKFMQDNDPKHTSRRAVQYFEDNNINWWRTPAESPDINPIEWLWKDLKWYIVTVAKPETQQQLVDGIRDYWESRVTKEVCIKYIDGISRKS